MALVKDIGKRVYAVKIHNILDEYGPGIISQIKIAGAQRVWVDHKLHDIPHTVNLRAKALRQNGADILTVHASGGAEMMRAAVENFSGGEVFAVSVLTSLSSGVAKNIFKEENIESLVLRLAQISKSAGVHGLVCGASEIKAIKNNPDLKEIKLVVPGIRSEGVEKHDQQRTDTPKNAIIAGACLLVVGRQITKAKDPVAALENLQQEIGNL